MEENEQNEHMLRRILDLAEENNSMLRKLRRGQIYGRIWSITYWTIIIGAAIGAFYFLQPYIDFVKSAAAQAETYRGGAAEFFKHLVN